MIVQYDIEAQFLREAYHSGRKCKDRLIFIFKFKPYLYFRPGTPLWNARHDCKTGVLYLFLVKPFMTEGGFSTIASVNHCINQPLHQSTITSLIPCIVLLYNSSNNTYVRPRLKPPFSLNRFEGKINSSSEKCGHTYYATCFSTLHARRDTPHVCTYFSALSNRSLSSAVAT